MNRVHCGWCGTLLRDGALPISHGCCENCAKNLLANYGDEPVPPIEPSIAVLVTSALTMGLVGIGVVLAIAAAIGVF